MICFLEKLYPPSPKGALKEGMLLKKYKIVMFLTRCMLGKLETGKSLKKVSWPLVYRSFFKVS